MADKKVRVGLIYNFDQPIENKENTKFFNTIPELFTTLLDLAKDQPNLTFDGGRLDLVYLRPETDEEKAQRERDEAQSKEWRRNQYEKLRQEFENE